MAEAKAKNLPITAADVVVFVGLGCLTTGAWSVVGLAALMLPGLVLVWYALPTRPPFVATTDRER
jgi:hypothetical protein